MKHGRLDPAGWSRPDTLRTEVIRLRVRDDQAEDARTAVLDQFQGAGVRRGTERPSL